MKTSDIVTAINADFTAKYRSATPFVGSGNLWDFCIATISNPISMSNIIFANDMGIPPVKSLLTIYERTMHPAQTFTFSGTESQSMGALMGFVFKFVLGYQGQKDRCTVNELGIKTAARFFDGPVVEIELD